MDIAVFNRRELSVNFFQRTITKEPQRFDERSDASHASAPHGLRSLQLGVLVPV